MTQFKEDVVRRIARFTRLPQRDVTMVLDLYVDYVKETLAAGQSVQHTGFGTFYTRERKEGTVRNVQTREVITVPARRVAAFRVGEVLKRRIASAKSARGRHAA